MLSHIFGWTNHNFFKKIKSLNASMPKKLHNTNFSNVWKKLSELYKLAKTKKKKLSQTLEPVSKCDKVFFPTKKKMHFSKKLWRKILFYFFESFNSQFWKNSPWNKLVIFWVGWIILFYFISNLMTSTKYIINFQFTIYMCFPLFLRLVGVNKPWRDGWMTGRMDDVQMDEMIFHDTLYYM